MKKECIICKRLIALSLCVSMLLTFAGCGHKDEKKEDTGTTTTVSYSGGVPDDIFGNDSEPDKTEAPGTQENTTSDAGLPSPTEDHKDDTPDDDISKDEISKDEIPLNKTYLFRAPLLPGDKSIQLTDNPNRGFRLETYMSVENGKYTPQMYDEKGNYHPEKGTDAIGWLYKYFDDYDMESPRIAQVYFYLTQYNDRDLDAAAIQNMNAFFEACRKLKVTVALRFAYVVTQGVLSQDCVSLQQMQRHMNQIKPVLAQNRDVLFCLEAGFMGEWGEQSEICSWRKNGQAGAIMNSIVDMVPSDLWVLARYASVRNTASPANQKRIGYHNDYIVGKSHPWDSGGVWDSDDYKNLVKWSENTLVEGEMPWGWQTPFQIDGWNVAKYLKTNHFTALSCYHNNREGGSIYDLKKWKGIQIDGKKLNQVGLPYYPEWFENSAGKPVSKNLYEYIRDYLGYHIFSSNAKVTVDNKKVSASFSLKNVGFAAPVAMKQIRLVLLDEAGKIVDGKTICGLLELKSGVQKKFSVSLTRPDTDHVYRLGLFIEAPNGVGAKMANDLEFVNGINILGSLN